MKKTTCTFASLLLLTNMFGAASGPHVLGSAGLTQPGTEVTASAGAMQLEPPTQKLDVAALFASLENSMERMVAAVNGLGDRLTIVEADVAMLKDKAATNDARRKTLGSELQKVYWIGRNPAGAMAASSGSAFQPGPSGAGAAE